MIISVTNQKGGVAKTTTVVNLAAGLALEGYATLVVDADPQTSTTHVLSDPADGVEVEKDQTLYPVMMNFAPLRSVVRSSRVANLDFVPSHIRLSSADLELANALDNRSERLHRALERVERTYDYIIIDTGPSLGLLTINALTASDAVLIPVAPEYFSLQGLAQLQETIDMVRQQLNPRLKILGVLAAKLEHTVVSRDVVAGLRQHFGDLVFETTIPKNVKIEEAHSRHTHIFDHAPTSAGAKAYKAFVQEVIAR